MTASFEHWRPVVGYEGLYEVSDHGRVRSCERRVRGRHGHPKLVRERILRPTTDAVGRISVTLSREGDHKTWRISVLALTAFVGPRPVEQHGCHNDGDPANNKLDNLRWDTQSENANDTIRHGRHPEVERTHCPRNHRLAAPNLMAANARSGKRACLACSRARNDRREPLRLGLPFDMQQAADARYDSIMRAA